MRRSVRGRRMRGVAIFLVSFFISPSMGSPYNYDASDGVVEILSVQPLQGTRLVRGQTVQFSGTLRYELTRTTAGKLIVHLLPCPLDSDGTTYYKIVSQSELSGPSGTVTFNGSCVIDRDRRDGVSDIDGITLTASLFPADGCLCCGSAIFDQASYSVLPKEDPAAARGDMDRDGTVDLTDAIFALKILSDLETSIPANRLGDLNGDGKIGLEEVLFILGKVSELR